METADILQLQRAAPFSLAIMTRFMFSFSYLLYTAGQVEISESSVLFN